MLVLWLRPHLDNPDLSSSRACPHQCSRRCGTLAPPLWSQYSFNLLLSLPYLAFWLCLASTPALFVTSIPSVLLWSAGFLLPDSPGTVSLDMYLRWSWFMAMLLVSRLLKCCDRFTCNPFSSWSPWSRTFLLSWPCAPFVHDWDWCACVTCCLMFLFLPSLVLISPVSHDLCASTTLSPSPITCSLPRLTAEMGEKEINRFQKDLEEEKKKEGARK